MAEILKPLPQSFYLNPVLTVAENLLGKLLVIETGKNQIVVKIVETEAYHENGDPSCHAHKGQTKRNAVMFGPPGHLYVYFTYGMHYCMNVVAEKEGTAAAVLIRAAEVIEGIDIVKKNRGERHKLKDLTNGPAKLCEALSITTEQNGISLLENKTFITKGQMIAKDNILQTTRIGISEGKELPWRFYIKDNEFVSKKVKIIGER
ncbi:MAG: DNA-3-methyladenine glycosylase [Spirochaetia bacterium]|nr:DNA-3-methyladenine glycosylase [Spirochaetia bacterium]